MEFHYCPELKGHLPSKLSCMEEIKIRGCYNLLETSHTLNWLSSIKKVNIEEDLDSEVYVQSTQWLMLEPESLLQHATFDSYPMPKPKMIMSSVCLTHLELYRIPSLTTFPTNGLPTSLQSLRIEGCRKLSLMPPETWRNYTSITSLDICESCDALTSIPLNGFPALQTLSISICRGLNSIFNLKSSPWPSSLRSLIINSPRSIEVNLRMDTLTVLEHLYLSCGELSFREGVCLPPKLQSIYIYYARTMPHVKEWGLQDLTSLSRLRIREKGEMDNTLRIDSMLPISLVSLSVSGNMSFEGNGLRHLSPLEDLRYDRCRHLKSLPTAFLPP